jgi:hypothetical protein
MISGSTTAGELLIPHFQFQTSAKTDKAKVIRIEMIRYMLDVRGTFGYEDNQSFPILLGINKKGGMDNNDFFEYLKKSIMKLYPDAAPVKGRWVVIKCDSGPTSLHFRDTTASSFIPVFPTQQPSHRRRTKVMVRSSLLSGPIFN